MLKLYEEHPTFDQYSCFDTKTGRLEALSDDQFNGFLPERLRNKRPREGLHCITHNNNLIFTGATPSVCVRFPRRIYFQITRKCNLLCDYCYIRSTRDAPHVPTEAIIKIARYLARQGLMEVRLTGGEPTLHPAFQEIVKTFQTEGVYVSVATNGLWSEQIRIFLCKQPYIWVICSLDGNKQTHERYRPGSFDAIVRNLTLLKHKNPTARIRLTTVLTRENRKQMMDLGRIGSQVGAESITVIPLRPQVRNPSIRTEMVEADQFKIVIEDLLKAKETYGLPFTTTMETEFKSQIYPDPIVRKRFSCAAGREATNLDYDADSKYFLVYGCSYSPASDLEADERLRRPFLAGAFAASQPEAFDRIWNDDQAWTIYRDLTIRSNACKQCAYLKKMQCTGSCPIQNIDYQSIDVREEVLDQLKEQITRTGEWYCYQTIFG